jgi:single-strand DNA-binding protein
MNHFIGIGRLTGAAELKYTAKGTACTKFSICISKPYKDADGKRQETVNFFNCVTWGKLGETIVMYLTKGKQVAIKGELEQNTWTDNSGDKHSTVQINVDELIMLASPRAHESADKDEQVVSHKSDKPDDIPF